MARRIIKEEGLLVGGSSGSALLGALKIAKELNIPENKRMVVIFVDTVRNYLTKFINDDWMLENGYFTQEEYDKINFDKNNERFFGVEHTLSDLKLTYIQPLSKNSLVQDVTEEFSKQKSECVRSQNLKYIYLIKCNFLASYSQ